MWSKDLLVEIRNAIDRLPEAIAGAMGRQRSDVPGREERELQRELGGDATPGLRSSAEALGRFDEQLGKASVALSAWTARLAKDGETANGALNGLRNGSNGANKAFQDAAQNLRELARPKPGTAAAGAPGDPRREPPKVEDLKREETAKPPSPAPAQQSPGEPQQQEGPFGRQRMRKPLFESGQSAEDVLKPKPYNTAPLQLSPPSSDPSTIAPATKEEIEQLHKAGAKVGLSPQQIGAQGMQPEPLQAMLEFFGVRKKAGAAPTPAPAPSPAPPSLRAAAQSGGLLEGWNAPNLAKGWHAPGDSLSDALDKLSLDDDDGGILRKPTRTNPLGSSGGGGAGWRRQRRMAARARKAGLTRGKVGVAISTTGGGGFGHRARRRTSPSLAAAATSLPRMGLPRHAPQLGGASSMTAMIKAASLAGPGLSNVLPGDGAGGGIVDPQNLKTAAGSMTQMFRALARVGVPGAWQASGVSGLLAGAMASPAAPLIAIGAVVVAAGALAPALRKVADSALESNRKYERLNARIAGVFALNEYRDTMRGIKIAGAVERSAESLGGAYGKFKDELQPWSEGWQRFTNRIGTLASGAGIGWMQNNRWLTGGGDSGGWIDRNMAGIGSEFMRMFVRGDSTAFPFMAPFNALKQLLVDYTTKQGAWDPGLADNKFGTSPVYQHFEDAQKATVWRPQQEMPDA